MADAITSMYPARLVADLANSGLVPRDIMAKPLSPAEKAATGTPANVDGYAIPYYDIGGKPLQFYRVKLYDRDKVKYLQVADSPNHIYFPPGFWNLVQSLISKRQFKFIIWTEGEKKAAKAVKEGFPCVAVGGVDSWRSRTLAVPKDAQIAQKPSGGLSIRMPQGGGIQEGMETVALGFQDLVNMAVRYKVPVLICYDCDAPQANSLAKYSFGISENVQRAAAILGYELRHRGLAIHNIRQLHLPAINEEKTGLDDYLIDQGSKGLQALIEANLQKRAAFPNHPNPREYVNRKLQKASLIRSEQIALSLAVLTDLDSKGQRLRDTNSGELYYFSYRDKSLTPVVFQSPNFAATPFARRLYREYGIGGNDVRILGWLDTQYSAEDPIWDVNPEKVLAWRGDTLYFQISDASMVKVSAKGIELLENGTEGVLFTDGLIEPLDDADFQKALDQQKGSPIQNWWEPILQDTRISADDGGSHKRLLSLLYYISPMFYRWRGTQLPVEITTGEAGSGKSTLFELRLNILTGVPKLRNSPTDLKDWNASLSQTGAMHVTDNVQMSTPELRNRLSDEMCRLVTESKPSIEQRKLYTDNTIVKIPVSVVFGITAIKQPFNNVDIIQRAVITTMDKGTDAGLTYDSQWGSRKLEERGGRVGWLAHQLLFVQQILKYVEDNWSNDYKARYRLINVEQLLQAAAKVCGWDPNWIPGQLEYARDKRAQEADWALEGLKAYTDRLRSQYPEHYSRREFTLADICSWAEQEDEFKTVKILTEPRNLRRYVESHKHTVATTTGLVATDKMKHGSVVYKIQAAR